MLRIPHAKRIVSATVIGLLAAPIGAMPLAASHDPRHGDPCGAPGEQGSFLCGVVIIDLSVGASIDPVLAACPPSGSVTEVAGPSYFIAVPVGREVESRDCFVTQTGVESAGLSYFGQVAPDTAMARERSGNLALAVGIVLTYLGLTRLMRNRQPSPTSQMESS